MLKKYYGIEYAYTYGRLSFSKIVANIDDLYPIIILARDGDDESGHFTVIYGYDNTCGTYVPMWNPGTGSTEIIYTGGSSVSYAYHNKIFTWTRSLSKSN